MKSQLKKKTPSVYLVSLGCSKNLVESEVFLGHLAARGIELAQDPRHADALVVNTCGFLQSAADESYQVIREMADAKGKGRRKGLYVFGCLVGRQKDHMEKALPGVDGFYGVGQMEAVAEAIAQKHGSGHPLDEFAMRNGRRPRRVLATPPHTAYLRIADGCNCKCTFCTIPSFRGRLASRPIDELVGEVEALVEGGVLELSIIAQDTTQYGEDLYGTMCIEKLLERLDDVEGLMWYRVLYAFPAHVQDGFIEFLGHGRKMCPYLDMPIQHADTEILRRMGRGINEEKQFRLIERIRAACPGIALRTTLLVGFPGETEEAFERLLQFVEAARFDHAGIFTFSPEPGTPSYSMPDQVPEEIRQDRYNRLFEIVERIGGELAKAKVGSDRDVIIDGESDIFPDFWRGRHAGQAPDVDGVTYVRRDGVEPGTLVSCRILGSEGFDLFAEKTNLDADGC